MKKLLSILLCLCLLLALAACGDDSQKPADETKQAAATTEPTTEATEPSMEATEPSTEATEPPTEAPEPSTEATEPSTEATEPSTEPTTPEMPSDWTSMTILLDGQMFSFPCSFSSFIDNGWSLDPDDGFTMDDLVPGTNIDSLLLLKGEYSVMPILANYSGNAVALTDCEVYGISLAEYGLPPVTLAGGLDFNATAQDFIDTWGEPEQIDYLDEEAGTIFRLSYLQEGDTYYYAEAYFSSITGKLSSIDMNLQYYEYAETESATECPDYLLEYTAPTELGDDNHSTKFMLDGVIYQLPCPLQQFLDNGWECEDPQEGIPGYNTGYLYLQKDGVEFTVTVTNFDPMQQMAKHCAVTDINFNEDSFEGLEEDILFIPGNIGFSQISEHAATIFADFYCSEYEGYYTYNYSESDFVGFWFYNYSIDFSYDSEDIYLSISNNNWIFG